MKRVLSVWLCVLLVLSTCTCNSSATSDPKNKDVITLSGISLTKDDFSETFVSTENADEKKEVAVLASTVLHITLEVMDPDHICAEMFLTYEGKEIERFQITGDLFKGYRSQVSDANSLVLDVEKTESKTKVLLFELVDGASDGNYYAAKETTEQSAIRVYLMNDERLFLFEDSLPSSLSICFTDKHEQITDPTKDFLWFSAFIEPHIEYLDPCTDPNITMILGLSEVMRDTGSTLWSGDTVYSTQFFVNGMTYSQLSIPFGFYRICNVNSGDATWKAEFYISESTRINNVQVDDYQNDIRYDSIEIGLVCGNKTEYQNLSLSGRVYKISLSGNIINATMDVVSAAVNWWSLAQSIYSVFAAMVDTGNDITLGTMYSQNFPSGTTAVGTKMQANHCMFSGSQFNPSTQVVTPTSSSHYLILQTEVNSTYVSNGSTSTSGAVRFAWRAYLHSTLSQIDYDSAEYKVDYTSSY